MRSWRSERPFSRAPNAHLSRRRTPKDLFLDAEGMNSLASSTASKRPSVAPGRSHGEVRCHGLRPVDQAHQRPSIR
jgi:hypothetical protein